MTEVTYQTADSVDIAAVVTELLAGPTKAIPLERGDDMLELLPGVDDEKQAIAGAVLVLLHHEMLRGWEWNPCANIADDLRALVTDCVEDAVGECAERIRPHIGGTTADYCGTLYMALTPQKGTGAFYTRPPAAALLSALAVPPDWCEWTHWLDVSRRRICDPSCGTGTLLHSTAAELVQNFRRANGPDHPDEPRLLRALAEDMLTGFDINITAIRLGRAMRMLMSDADVDVNMYVLPFGVGPGGEVRCGALELLTEDIQHVLRVGADTTEMVIYGRDPHRSPWAAPAPRAGPLL